MHNCGKVVYRLLGKIARVGPALLTFAQIRYRAITDCPTES